MSSKSTEKGNNADNMHIPERKWYVESRKIPGATILVIREGGRTVGSGRVAKLLD